MNISNEKEESIQKEDNNSLKHNQNQSTNILNQNNLTENKIYDNNNSPNPNQTNTKIEEENHDSYTLEQLNNFEILFNDNPTNNENFTNESNKIELEDSNINGKNNEMKPPRNILLNEDQENYFRRLNIILKNKFGPEINLVYNQNEIFVRYKNQLKTVKEILKFLNESNNGNLNNSELHPENNYHTSGNTYSNQSMKDNYKNEDTSSIHYDTDYDIFSIDVSKNFEKNGIMLGNICSLNDSQQNLMEIIEIDINNRQINRRDINFLKFPASKTMWDPTPLSYGQTNQLLAVTSDKLRLYNYEQQTGIQLENELQNDLLRNLSAPLTSFDWSDQNNYICCSSIDTTCSLYDINVQKFYKQIIAHDKEVNE